MREKVKKLSSVNLFNSMKFNVLLFADFIVFREYTEAF